MKIQRFKPIVRIKRVMNFYYIRGINSERINDLYRKILTREQVKCQNKEQ
jgi:hypothetical protein